MTETATATANGGDYTSLGPTAPGEVMITWAHDANDPAAQEAWTRQVVSFTTALRTVGGIDADLDLFHLFEAGINWTRWGPTRVRTASRILIVINAAWRQRFEGEGSPTRGAGAAAEANVLLGQFNENRETFEARTVLVVLPGASEADVPTQLQGLQRVHVDTFDAAGIDGLIRLLTDQPLYPKPAVGQVPILPPATQQDIARVAENPDQLRVTPSSVERTAGVETPTASLSSDLSADLSSTSTLSASVHVIPVAAEGDARTSGEAALSVSPVEETALRTWADIADPSAVAPPPVVITGSSFATIVRTAQQEIGADAGSAIPLRAVLRVLERQHVAQRPSPPRPPTLSEETSELLGVQLKRIEPWLERPNRCWLLLASQPVITSPEQMGPSPAGAKQRAERLLRRMVEQTWLPVTLSGFDSATRASRLTVFAGHPSPAFQPGPRSTHWRLELADRGEGVAAASIGGDVRADGGLYGPFGQPEKNTIEARLSLPVRRDRLEMWLLVQLELLAAHYLSAAKAAQLSDSDKPLVIGLQAQLVLPSDLTLDLHDQAFVTGVRVVEEHRDPDGSPTGEFPCAGGRPLPLETGAASTEVMLVDIGCLDQPTSLVLFAHRLAVQLLEHFGLESTQVLTDGGELDELAAGAADQQHVWQHARALGIPHDQTSPAARRKRHSDLMAQARAALRR